MKIEIDFSRPDELRRIKRELEIALATIDGALVAITKNGHSPDQPLFPQIASNPKPPTDSGDPGVNAIISALPEAFNMREAKMAAEQASIPDSRLRRSIARIIESGSLIMVQKGQGRRSAIFRKA